MDAMILAAGRGERMRPLTDRLPKPLVLVRGRPLIEYHIVKLVNLGVSRIVINTSYLADVLMTTLGDGVRFGCELVYSYESSPLESGGGVATASRHFRHEAVILLSADIYSEFDYAYLLPSIAMIEKRQRSAHFVLVEPTSNEPGGEFALHEDGLLHLGEPRLTLANISVLATQLCRGWPRDKPFKLLPHYQQWVRDARVSGELFHGRWCNVTQVEDVERLNAI